MGIQIWRPTGTFGKVMFLFNKVIVANSAEFNSRCQEWELKGCMEEYWSTQARLCIGKIPKEQ